MAELRREDEIGLKKLRVAIFRTSSRKWLENGSENLIKNVKKISKVEILGSFRFLNIFEIQITWNFII